MCSPNSLERLNYQNYPRREDNGLYTRSGEPMNEQNHNQELATPGAWENMAAQNIQNSTPIQPSLVDYVSLAIDMFGPRTPYEYASNGTKRVFNKGMSKEPLDNTLQRVWSE